VNSLSKAILKHRKTVITIFLILTLVCVVLQFKVKVNYNMVDYLPEDAPSTVSLAIMEKEFTQAMPNTRVLLYDVSIQEALAYKEKLSQIDGVSDLLWLDDVIDIKQPLETADSNTVENYYKNNNAIITLTMRDGDEVEILNKIYELIGKENAVSGQAVTLAVAQNLSTAESAKAFILLVPTIILILLLTTSSFFEPFLFLCAVGVAVLINMGTNLFFEEISYITQSISPILQMAVSLDYAIFLLHSFEKYRKETPDVEKAMQMAMKRSLSTILASALTTLFGFLALVFMGFQIGSDLGINLAKGITISLISVMVFLPALTLGCYKIIDKTKHRSLMPSFTNFGKTMVKTHIVAFILVLLILVPAFLAQKDNSFIYGMGDLDRTTRAGQDELKIDEAFGQSMPLVILVPKGEYAKEVALCEDLKKIPYVTSVISYATMVGVEIPGDYLDGETISQFYSQNYCRIILYATVPTEGSSTFSVVENMRNTASKYYGENILTCGQGVNLYDIKNVVTADNMIVNFIAIGAIAIVLLFTFKSISLPIILVLTIETSIWLNLSVSYFSNTAICYIGFLVIGTVQLGATVDYAILFSDHYMANRKENLPKSAVQKTAKETVGSILTSGSILAIAGFILQAISTNDVVKQLGGLLGRGTLLSMVMVFFFLPAALIILDKVIARTTKNSNFRQKENQTYEKIS